MHKEIMEEKKYIAPTTEVVHMTTENIMITASPGVGGSYNPSEEIGAKKNDFFEEDVVVEWPTYNFWDE